MLQSGSRLLQSGSRLLTSMWLQMLSIGMYSFELCSKWLVQVNKQASIQIYMCNANPASMGLTQACPNYNEVVSTHPCTRSFLLCSLKPPLSFCFLSNMTNFSVFIISLLDNSSVPNSLSGLLYCVCVFALVCMCVIR